MDQYVDLSTSEMLSAIQEHYEDKYGPGSMAARLFTEVSEEYLEASDEQGLEDFLQLEWDRINGT